MHINRKIVPTFPCCCYMYLRLFLKIGFCFKIGYGYRYCCKDHLKISNTTRSKILPYNWGENNIPECSYRRATLFLRVLSMTAAFREYVVFFFLDKIITLNIKVSLNLKNKSDTSIYHKTGILLLFQFHL